MQAAGLLAVSAIADAVQKRIAAHPHLNLAAAAIRRCHPCRHLAPTFTGPAILTLR
jgi:hypothetical protein